MNPRRVMEKARARGMAALGPLLERAGGAYSAEQWRAVAGPIASGFSVPTPAGSVYPRFQLSPTGEHLPGLDQVLRAFTLPDPWMQLAILLEPSPQLGGRTPRDALRGGDVAGPSLVARSYGSHGA